jgi:hypothetical protein
LAALFNQPGGPLRHGKLSCTVRAGLNCNFCGKNPMLAARHRSNAERLG